MSMIIKGRGSERLAGAASLKHRMPMVGDRFHSYRYSSVGRATDFGICEWQVQILLSEPGAANTAKHL